MVVAMGLVVLFHRRGELTADKTVPPAVPRGKALASSSRRRGTGQAGRE